MSFAQPVLYSSDEILRVLKSTDATLTPTKSCISATIYTQLKKPKGQATLP
uniref:Uncharacterized protein n=1 Tax=Arundo donax TaxID=35708 RepID=A0A0A9CCP6_ARUDO